MSAFIRPTLLRFFSPTQVLRKAAPGEQLGLFGAERKPVRRPGSRGGKYWVTQRGDIRYGERPVPGTPAYEALPPAESSTACTSARCRTGMGRSEIPSPERTSPQLGRRRARGRRWLPLPGADLDNLACGFVAIWLPARPVETGFSRPNSSERAREPTL
jgi:hypothetical protein